MANPWEIAQQSTTVQAKPRTAKNPWDIAASKPASKTAAPWEIAKQNPQQKELETARLEESTLFGRGQAQTVLGEMGAGLQSGVRQVMSTLPALGALANAGLDYIPGVETGDAARHLLEVSQDIASGGARRGVARVEDIDPIRPFSYLRYMAGVTGEALPFMATILAGGGGARLLANKLAARAVPGSTRAMLNKVPAEIVGSVATASAIETGATAQELHQATGEVRPLPSIIAGTAKGALESVFPLVAGKALGLTGFESITFADRLIRGGAARNIGTAVAVEGSTEAAQEEIDIQTRAFIDQNYSRLSPEANSRRLNALVAGATGGGVLSTGVELARSRPVQDSVRKLTELRVKAAAGDIPIVTGQPYNELPTTDRTEAIRTAQDGLDAGAALEDAYDRDTALDEVFSGRSLYGAVVPGVDTSFGSQSQAADDGAFYNAQGFARLDPTKVTWGEVTSSIEDLPNTVNSGRVAFLGPNAQGAQDALVQAIKIKSQASAARSGLETERLLVEANKFYRQAIDLGARVEPLPDGQVMLRDRTKLDQLIEPVEKLQAQVSRSGLASTRVLPGGKKFHVFDQEATPDSKDPNRGKQLDLERVSPDAITSLPSMVLARRVLASHEVSRRLSLGRARGLGIRFVAPKFKRVRTKVKPTGITLESRIEPDPLNPDFHYLNVSRDGKPIAYMHVSEHNDGKTLAIEMIGSMAKKDRVNSLGPKDVRNVARQLKLEFPNAEILVGFRISGAREKSKSTGMTSIDLKQFKQETEQEFLSSDKPPSVPRQKALLRDFVRQLQSLTAAGKGFSSQDPQVIEAFMRLADHGLRLDVGVDTSEFALLEQVGENVLSSGSEATAGVQKSKDTSRIVKPRAGSKSRVSRYVAYESRAVQDLFFTQLHNSEIQRVLVGEIGKAGSSYKAHPSPIGDMLRSIVKDIGVATDYVIEIVSPQTLGDKGVRWVDKSILLPGGRNTQTRSVLQINPWFYARPTEGAKVLEKKPNRFAIKGQGFARIWRINNESRRKRVQLPDGSLTTIGEWLQENNIQLTPDSVLLFSYGKDFNNIPTFMVLSEHAVQDLMGRPEVAPISGTDEHHQTVREWVEAALGEDVPKPKYRVNKSRAAKIAEAIGTGDTKQTVPALEMGKFFSDFAIAASQSIVAYEWERTPADVQELVRTAFKRERNQTKGTSRQRQISRTVPHPLIDRTLKELRGKDFRAYEFEEWLVNQMARYFTRPRKQLSAVEKFFTKVAGSVKYMIDSLFSRAGKGEKPYSYDPELGDPNEVVLKWIANLQLRGLDNTEAPFLDKATRESLLKSIDANRAALEKEGVTDDVVMSPQRASTHQIRQLIKLLPKENSAARQRLEALLSASDRYNTILDWGLGVHQLADLNRHIPGITEYASLTRAMENGALSWATLADRRLRKIQKLGKERLAKLTDMLFQLDQMTYLDQKKLKDGTEKARWPTGDELLAIVQSLKIDRPTFDAYLELRNDFLQFLSYLENTSINKARETIKTPELLEAKIREIQGETAQLKSRPYFPHMRFGRYTVTIRDNAGKVIHSEFFDTEADRAEAVKDLQKRFNVPKDNAMSEGYVTDRLWQWQGLPGFAMLNVVEALGLNEEGITPQQVKDKEMLESLAFRTLPTESFRKSFINRKNIPGFSNDILRAYANYFGRASRFMARVEFSGRMEQAIKTVVDSASPVSKDKRQQIGDFLTRHYNAQMQPSNDWADLRGLGFLWYFAFVPSAAFVNLTQVPLVTVPFLSAKFGDLKTSGKVIEAIGQNSKELWDWLRGNVEVEQTPKQEALEEAHFNRLIDDGYATELAAISQGPTLQRTLAGTSGQRALRRFAQWGTLPFALAERFNRSVTFRAAYDMALKDNNNPWINSVMQMNKAEADQLRIDRGWEEPHLRAYMAAAEAVRRTQFEYGRWSRPKLMEGPRGVVLMFKTYLQNMLYFMFKSDRRTQVRFALLMMATAGIMGFPGADDATEIVKFLARQFGLDFDAERELRALMVEWGTDEAVNPDIILHGASREGFGVPALLNGLGIPAPRIDLSGSLSMGRIVPGLKSGLNPGAGFARDAVGEVVSEVAGPVFGVPFALYQSLTDKSLPAADPKRWERAMPRAFKALSRSSRYLAEGRERDRTGATVIEFDPNDVNDQADILMGVGLGFQPTRLSQQWDYLTAQKEVQDYWKGQRAMLMNDLWRAHRMKDKEGVQDAISSIKRYNTDVPHKALRITSQQVRQSVKTRQRNKLLKEHSIPREKFLRGTAREVDLLYPEVITRDRVPSQ